MKTPLENRKAIKERVGKLLSAINLAESLVIANALRRVQLAVDDHPEIQTRMKCFRETENLFIEKLHLLKRLHDDMKIKQLAMPLTEAHEKLFSRLVDIYKEDLQAHEKQAGVLVKPKKNKLRSMNLNTVLDEVIKAFNSYKAAIDDCAKVRESALKHCLENALLALAKDENYKAIIIAANTAKVLTHALEYASRYNLKLGSIALHIQAAFAKITGRLVETGYKPRRQITVASLVNFSMHRVSERSASVPVLAEDKGLKMFQQCMRKHGSY